MICMYEIVHPNFDLILLYVFAEMKRGKSRITMPTQWTNQSSLYISM